jgi:hypothetical protein
MKYIQEAEFTMVQNDFYDQSNVYNIPRWPEGWIKIKKLSTNRQLFYLVARGGIEPPFQE